MVRLGLWWYNAKNSSGSVATADGCLHFSSPDNQALAHHSQLQTTVISWLKRVYFGGKTWPCAILDSCFLIFPLFSISRGDGLRLHHPLQRCWLRLDWTYLNTKPQNLLSNIMIISSKRWRHISHRKLHKKNVMKVFNSAI